MGHVGAIYKESIFLLSKNKKTKTLEIMKLLTFFSKS